MGGGRKWEPRSGMAQAMEEVVPEPEVGEIKITEETITKALKKKKN